MDWPELKELIICQTVIDALDSRDRTRTIRKLIEQIENPSKKFVFFSNTVFSETAITKNESTLLDTYNIALVKLGEWYYKHFQKTKTVSIIVTDSTRYNNYQTEGVEYVDFQSFVEINCPNKLNEFEEIKRVTENSDMDITTCTLEEHLIRKISAPSKMGFTEYLTKREIEDGLSNKTLIQGTIKFLKPNRKDKLKKAIIDRNSSGKPSISIKGDAYLNRAIHGDFVAVKILDKTEIQALERFNAGSVPDELEITENGEDKTTEIIEYIDFGEQIDGDFENVDDEVNKNVEDMVYGRVVGIIKREWRPYVATLQADDTNSLYQLVVPFDINIPKIRIHYLNPFEIKNARIVVVIDEWPLDSKYPQGHFVRCLGKSGDLESEIDSLLVEYGIATSQSDLEFSMSVLNEMPVDTPENPWKPDYSDEDRLDIRNKIIFSIDPIGSLDIDDAISFETLVDPKTGKPEYEMGVHIADASCFIRPGSESDLEARKRGTTIYLADRRFNMIPEVLSEKICSIRAGRDRYAVSVIWKLDYLYNIKSVWYGRTLIKSTCEMSYESAQWILNDTSGVHSDSIGNSFKLEKSLDNVLRPRICGFAKAMQILRSRRMENGALELESTEIKFSYNSEKQIQSMKPKEKLVIHGVIEEAMVMANSSVAKRVLQYYPNSAMLRIHTYPKPERFETLKNLAKLRGFQIDCSSNLALSKSLKFIEEKAGKTDRSFVFLLKSMTVFALSEACYISASVVKTTGQDFKHYGLAVDFYTHFTSPIRRYSDIVVHRQLLETLKMDKNKIKIGDDNLNNQNKSYVFLNTPDYIEKISDHLNTKNRNSKIVQRASTLLFQTKYIQNLISKLDKKDVFVKKAVITGISTNGLLANIPDIGLTCQLRFKSDIDSNQSNEDHNQVLVPLSALSGKLEDMNVFIPGCVITSTTSTLIEVMLPLKLPLVNKNRIDNANDDERLVSEGEYVQYLNKFCKDKKKDIGLNQPYNSILDNSDERLRKIVFTVFDSIEVVVKIKDSSFRHSQLYFVLVKKNVGTIKPSSNIQMKTTQDIKENSIQGNPVQNNDQLQTNKKSKSKNKVKNVAIYPILEHFRQLSITNYSMK
ncbi:hypothetical protein BB558_000069 [Smittium angustum]|nr:hypothetical protein BB558_000069 [Smittium angustum]